LWTAIASIRDGIAREVGGAGRRSTPSPPRAGLNKSWVMMTRYSRSTIKTRPTLILNTKHKRVVHRHGRRSLFTSHVTFSFSFDYSINGFRVPT
jgi:hypothetical protein